jgi:hypothetical protein
MHCKQCDCVNDEGCIGGEDAVPSKLHLSTCPFKSLIKIDDGFRPGTMEAMGHRAMGPWGMPHAEKWAVIP